VNFFLSWIKRPVAAAMILLVFVSIAMVVLFDIRIGPSAGSGTAAYSVIINYYGVDAGRIERDITQPLENAISVIPGIEEVTSTSEYSKSRVDVTVPKVETANEVYLSLRDAVERVYSRLPSAVQKPVIVSSSMDKRPVFIVAFKSGNMNREQLSQFIEKEVKSSYERIDGTGEIEIGGGETREIHVTLNPQRAASAGLSPAKIASIIRESDVLLPLGKISDIRDSFPIVMQGRLETIDALKNLMITIPDAGQQKLGLYADISFQAREKDSISRVNGEQQVIIYIQSSGSANLVNLSQNLRAETVRWNSAGFQTDTLLDSGKKIEDSIMQVINAIIEGMILVILILAFSTGSIRQILILSILLPVVTLLTIGVLGIMKISLDAFILAGIAVGIGNVVDSAIVLTEACKTRKSGNNLEAVVKAFMEVIPSLISSVLTTIVVLIPLFFLGNLTEGIRSVSISVGIMMAITISLTIFFVPPFYLLNNNLSNPPGKRKLFSRISFRFFYRILYGSGKKVIDHPVFCLGISLCILVAAGVIVTFIGKDLSSIRDEDSVFVHAEYESGTSVAASDKKSKLLSDMILTIQGVERIETNAKFGNAEIMIRFDPAKLSKENLEESIKSFGLRIPNSFIYIPEVVSPLDKKLEIAVMGDDNRRLQELAKSTAHMLQELPWVDQVVLHFKDGPPVHTFDVDHEKAFNAGLTASSIANFLRWNIHGPVAQKWIDGRHEIDLRVMAEEEQVSSLDLVEETAFPLEESRLAFLTQLGSFRKQAEFEESRIYRKNRQRAVFFTVHTKNLDLDGAISHMKKTLAEISLPEGYAFELDKSASKLAEQFRTMWFVLLLAIVLIYMILAAQSESLLCPFLICTTVPISLAFPLIALFLSGQTLTTPILIGLIMLAGLAVNNTLLIADLTRENMLLYNRDYSKNRAAIPVLFALRKRIKDLLITSGTSILGALPLMLVGSQGNNMMNALAFVVFWGIIGSLIVSFIYVPAVIALFPRLLKPLSFQQ